MKKLIVAAFLSFALSAAIPSSAQMNPLLPSDLLPFSDPTGGSAYPGCGQCMTPEEYELCMSLQRQYWAAGVPHCDPSMIGITAWCSCSWTADVDTGTTWPAGSNGK